MKCMLTLTIMPSIAEKCEGCGEPDKTKVQDIEVRNKTRQVARVFLCERCLDHLGNAMLDEATK